MPELDISRAPRGVLAAQQLVTNVAAIGDFAERHYLELKSTLDLSTKRDKEKIAKFILGAANRMPDVASTAFEGYGVMVIGVSKDLILGIPTVEMMDISKVVQNYVGAGGPLWDILWIPVEESINQVLVIIVDPPRLGQGPFACRASGESLTDGRIYIRVEGETREARAEEVDLLVRRGTVAAPVEVDFAVEVWGEVAHVGADATATVEEYIGGVRRRLLSALPDKPSEAPQATQALSAAASHQFSREHISNLLSGMSSPEKRTESDYRLSIDRWEEQFREGWVNALPLIAASQLRAAFVRVSNRSTTFFHGVEIKLHLAGDIFAYDYRDPDYNDRFNDLKLPLPPRKWGPIQSIMGAPSFANMGTLYTPSAQTYIPPSVSYRNGGSVDLQLNVGELRPRGMYESEDEELVLIVDDKSLSSIDGTWELTARGHDMVFSGEITVAVDPSRDLTTVARQILGLVDKTTPGS